MLQKERGGAYENNAFDKWDKGDLYNIRLRIYCTEKGGVGRVREGRGLCKLS